MAGVCGMQHVVEADGSVYPCDFYVLDGYRLGNLCTDSFEAIGERRKALGFIEQSRAVDEKCRVCRFFALCRGGCRRYRPVQRKKECGLPGFGPCRPRLFSVYWEGLAKTAGGVPPCVLSKR